MGRKSKQAGGHMPLTHYERTKKFVSSEYGTKTQRLAGHSQYQIGYCALSITKITNENENDSSAIAMCTPSGYIYSKHAIIEYLVSKQQCIKEEQKAIQEQQQKEQAQTQQDTVAAAKNKAIDAFENAQRVVKKRKTINETQVAQNDLKRTSYWLANSQPSINSNINSSNSIQEETTSTAIVVATPTTETSQSDVLSPPPRPLSPFSQQPLRRKDIWPVWIEWNSTNDNSKVLCSMSHKTIQSQPALAYWTKDTTKPGTIVLETVFNDLIATTSNNKTLASSNNDNNKNDEKKKSKMTCPTTGETIKYT